MHRRLCGALATGALVFLLGAAAAQAAKSSPLTTWIDSADGYTITLPTSWKLIPRSKAAVKARIAELKAKKSTQDKELALTYSSILDSPEGVSELSSCRLQAFPWPPDLATPILTEVSVRVIHMTLADNAADLAQLGEEYDAALQENKGAKTDAPRQVKLSAGAAEYVQGTVPVGGGLSNGVEAYLIPHHARLYELTFTLDSRLMAKATIFAAIAEHFAFT